MHLQSDDFFRKFMRQELTAPFPSTTNATTSLLTTRLPLEHGWFGWGMYFPEISRNIDVFRNKESMTREPVDCPRAARSRYPHYFDEIQSDYAVHTVFYSYIHTAHPQQNHVYQDKDGFFRELQQCCEQLGKQFPYVYYQEPDSIMHACGDSGKDAGAVIQRLSDKMGQCHAQSKNTLFVITAEHGQIDIDGYVELYRDQKLMDMLNIYPYMECRAVAFSVKNQYQDRFESYFSEKYHEDLLIFKPSDMVHMQLFGDRGNTAGHLGDFIASGTYTHKQARLFPGQRKLKGRHASLTEEMRIPMIIAGY